MAYGFAIMREDFTEEAYPESLGVSIIAIFVGEKKEQVLETSESFRAEKQKSAKGSETYYVDVFDGPFFEVG